MEAIFCCPARHERIAYKYSLASQVNFTRDVDVDGSGRLLTMRTLALDPPIFEIENFLSDRDCARVQELAAKEGYCASRQYNHLIFCTLGAHSCSRLLKSDVNYLDGSVQWAENKGDDMSETDANKLFRYSQVPTLMSSLLFHACRTMLIYGSCSVHIPSWCAVSKHGCHTPKTG